MSSTLRQLLASQTLDDILAADDLAYDEHNTWQLCSECGAPPCDYCGYCHQTDLELDHFERCPEVL